MYPLSTYLFACPSFMEGAARILDFGNTLYQYNYSPTPEDADYVAIDSDWRLVGADVYRALCHYPQRYREVLTHGRYNQHRSYQR